MRKDNHRIRLAISRLSVTTCATILTVWRDTGYFGHVGKRRSADGEKLDETSGEQERNYLGSPHNRQMRPVAIARIARGIQVLEPMFTVQSVDVRTTVWRAGSRLSDRDSSDISGYCLCKLVSKGKGIRQ